MNTAPGDLRGSTLSVSRNFFMLHFSSESPVVADFGCGEARLARAISSSCKKVFSFDLVAANPLVRMLDKTA